MVYNIKEKANSLPNSPGVYLMKDSCDNVIYVGKSKNLKARVSSYFINSSSHSSKVKKLVSHVRNIDHRITDTEFEALILECRLIKKLKPQYNTLIKNDKRYCFIKLRLTDSYPYLILDSVRERNSKGLYLGPFTSQRRVNIAITGIKEYFKILCSNTSDSGSECLNCSLGFCIGVCTKSISHSRYETIFKEIKDLLYGLDDTLIDDFKERMNKSASQLDFEKAIKYRNYISSIEYVIEKLRVLEYMKSNKTVIVVETLKDKKFKVFLIRGNKILLSKRYTESCLLELKTDVSHALGKRIDEEVEITFENLYETQIIYSYLRCKTKGTDYQLLSNDSKDIETKLTELLETNK